MKRNELKKVYPLQQLLQKLNTTQQKIILQYLNEDGCDAIYECMHNALYNDKITIRCKKKLKTALQDKKHICRSLLNPKLSKKVKQNRLVQTGGSLSLILSTVLPLLGQFLFGSKK